MVVAWTVIVIGNDEGGGKMGVGTRGLGSLKLVQNLNHDRDDIQGLGFGK